MVCDQHREQLSCFCQNCQQILCIDCIYSQKSHKTHKILTTKQASQFLKQKYKVYKDLVAEHQKQVETNLESLQQNKVVLENKFMNIDIQIDNFFDEIYEQIKKKQAEIKNNLASVFQSSIQKQNAKLEEYKSLQSIISDCFEFDKILAQQNVQQAEMYQFSAFQMAHQKFTHIKMDLDRVTLDLTDKYIDSSKLQNLKLYLDKAIKVKFSKLENKKQPKSSSYHYSQTTAKKPSTCIRNPSRGESSSKKPITALRKKSSQSETKENLLNMSRKLSGVQGYSNKKRLSVKHNLSMDYDKISVSPLKESSKQNKYASAKK